MFVIFQNYRWIGFSWLTFSAHPRFFLAMLWNFKRHVKNLKYLASLIFALKNVRVTKDKQNSYLSWRTFLRNFQIFLTRVMLQDWQDTCWKWRILYWVGGIPPFQVLVTVFLGRAFCESQLITKKVKFLQQEICTFHFRPRGPKNNLHFSFLKIMTWKP